MLDLSFSRVSSGTRGRFLAVGLLLMGMLSMSDCLANALENYLHEPDASFAWKRTDQKKIKDATLTHLELISQTWRGHFWSHDLLVVRPTTLRQADIAMLFIADDGYNARDEKEADRFHEVAQRAGAVVAILNKVPNQPLYDGLKEDALIAFTFDQYLKTGDPTWPLLFPMVKSAVRAMDTLQTFGRQEFDQTIERFVVSGASKRGWTSWLTAAVDTRVVGIAPMVIDMLNMKAQLDWTEKMYGRQSDEISDYTDLKLHQKLDDPPMQTLRAWVDPYSYRRSYTMPKLLLLGTNDPYWVVDSLRHYWSDLPESKLVFQTPNAGHDLGHDAWQTLAAWFQMIADHQPLPNVEWELRDGTKGAAGLTVRVDQPASNIRLWTAHSVDRDFRDEKWTSRELKINLGSNRASADVPKSAAGFTAFLAEVELTAPTGHSYKLSTQVQVIPDGVSRCP
ncbi:MAG TPA: PhoPQ-activated protein PqaA family protein [Terrimicrobium sp.]